MPQSGRPITQYDLQSALSNEPTEPVNILSSSNRPEELWSKLNVSDANAVPSLRLREPNLSKPEATKNAEPLRPNVLRAVQFDLARESPWKLYEKAFEVQLHGSITVAVRTREPKKLVHVREFSASSAEATLQKFRKFKHRSFVEVLETFFSENGIYIVLEYMPMSLERVVATPAYPNEAQLAAILGQILQGLAYLEAEGMEHRGLSCSTILVDLDGCVKIAHQEDCCVVSHTRDGLDVRRPDLYALSYITMDLMQKYAKENDAIGIDDLRRWNSSSDAVSFLSATTSATSAHDLLKHQLVSRPWKKESLLGLFALTQVCSRGDYKLLSSS